jgi:capsular exopolysaccharide synthesis family protein
VEAPEDLGRQIHRIGLVLSKRKWWVLGCLFLAAAATLVFTSRQPKVYRATASVIIEAQPPRVLSGVKDVVELGASSNYWSLREYFQTQYRIITGLEICERVVQRLNLTEDPAFLGSGPGEVLSDAEIERRIAARIPAQILQSRLNVQPVRDSMMVEVSAEDGSPVRAVEIVNEVVFTYRAQNIEYRREMTQEANADLRDMVAKYRMRKEQADQELLDFERKHSIGSFQVRKQSLEDRLAMLNERHGQMLVRKADTGSRLARVRKILKVDDPFSVPLETVLSSPLVNQLKAKLVDLRDERTSLAVQYGDKHPRIRALDSQIESVEDTVRREVRTFLTTAQGDFDEIQASIKEVEDLLGQANRDLAGLSTLQVEFNVLAERKKDASEIYDQIRTRFTEIDLSSQVESNNVRIHELAQEPTRPIRPDMRLNLALGVMAGLLLGLGLAFLVEQLDNTVKDRTEVERLSGVPCLGQIPSIPGPRKRRSRRKDTWLQERDFYILANPKSLVSEALNTVRTNLLFILPDRKIRSMLITSGSPWEGKSTLVIALGILQARHGSRTLIIDTDMRRPRLHRAFGVPNDHGLSSILLGGIRASEAIQTTSVTGLDILTCGPVPPNPSELLRMESLSLLIKELKGMYDTILLDSPPVIPVADPRILAGLVDGVLLVVKPGHTTQDALVQVRRDLQAAGAPLLGTVLNDQEMRQGRYGYRYGYGYGTYGYPAYPSIHDDERTAKTVDDRQDTGETT